MFSKEAIPASLTNEDSVSFPKKKHFLRKENMTASMPKIGSGVQRIPLCLLVNLT